MVKEITGSGADACYDVVGADMFYQCVRACRQGGRICVAGFTGSKARLFFSILCWRFKQASWLTVADGTTG